MRTTRKGNLRKGSFSKKVPDIMKLKDTEISKSSLKFITCPLKLTSFQAFHGFQDPLVLISHKHTKPEQL